MTTTILNTTELKGNFYRTMNTTDVLRFFLKEKFDFKNEMFNTVPQIIKGKEQFFDAQILAEFVTKRLGTLAANELKATVVTYIKHF